MPDERNATNAIDSRASSLCVGWKSVAGEPDSPPMDDVERARRRAFVAEHRTAVFGYPRRDHGPSMSVVYYVMDGDDRILVSTMRDRGKAKAVARNPKVSLCACSTSSGR